MPKNSKPSPKTPKPPIPMEPNQNPETVLLLKKKNLEKTNNKMVTFIENYDVSLKSQLPSRLQNYQPLLTEYKNILEELELLNTNFTFDEDFDEVESTYFKNIGKLNDLLKDNTSDVKPDTHRDNAFNIKLPPISLPRFNGDPKYWVTFRDNFQSLIHDKTNIPYAQKLHYLKSCLSQGALDLINNLKITDDNYLIAWELLKTRYSNLRIISQSHVKALLELPKIKNNSFKELNELFTEFFKNVEALRALDKEVDSSDFLLVPILCSKLDITTLKKWEESLSPEDNSPKLLTLKSFILKQLAILQISKDSSSSTNNDKSSNSKFDKNNFNQNKTSSYQNKNYKNQPYNQPSTIVYSSSPKGTSHTYFDKNNKSFKDNSPKCLVCKDFHRLYICPSFNQMTPRERLAKTESLNICKVCLNNNHDTANCRTTTNCKVCNKRHSTLLHIDGYSSGSKAVTGAVNMSGCSQTSEPNSAMTSKTLLATAVVEVQNKFGESVLVRAMIDTGAENSFASEHLTQILNLEKLKIKPLSIVGITQNTAVISNYVSVVIKSTCTDYKVPLNLLVLRKIIDKLPQCKIDTSNWNLPDNIALADPMFYCPSRVDLLLGAEVAFEIIKDGVCKLSPSLPTIRNSSLGWLVAGKYVPHSAGDLPDLTMSCINIDCHENNLENLITKFWEIEDLSKSKTLSKEQRQVEEYYSDTTTRDSTGRYIVKLPFKGNPSDLGESYNFALKRLNSLQRKFKINPDIHDQYNSFIEEYVALGHMEELSTEEIDKVMAEPHYFIPHREVIREGSLTTKIRVVFNASMPTSSGVSLNDILEVGPPLQKDIFNIILRFRSRRYALVADVEKMFRQVLVYKPHTNFQLILWKKPDGKLVVYRLLTLTYGTSPAPYLSQRSLNQLAYDEKDNFPLASACALEDFYVDDLLVSADDLETLYNLQSQLSEMMHNGGMNLRKWGSNNKEFIDSLAKNEPDIECFTLDLSKDTGIKTLGVNWMPNEDVFVYKVNIEIKENLTKRFVLSQISKVYDPLGLLGPVIIKAKIFIQNLWLEKISWDEPLSSKLAAVWETFSADLLNLNNYALPRFIAESPAVASYELHGFCDASEAAYAACVYLKITYLNREPSSNLLCSKSRVAPVKKLTLPRLELCGALLLSRLITKVLESLKSFKFSRIYYWTDSTIVLHWIAADSVRWKTFVGNRVSEIQESTHNGTWLHVSSSQNPADLASRGLNPSKFIEMNDFWIHGPDFILLSHTFEPPVLNHDYENLPETKENIHVNLVSIESNEPNLKELFDITKFISWKSLYKTLAYVYRFISNLKSKTKNKNTLSVNELIKSQTVILRFYQKEMFPDELKLLTNSKPLNATNRLLSLSPFLDNDSLIRVGGRIINADVPFSQKHPYLLDSKHYLTKLIVDYYHNKYYHIGPQQLLFTVRLKFWPIHGKNLCRQVVHSCITCYKVKPKPHSYLMGDLPKSRVNISPPFQHCSIDFAGPINYKISLARNPKLYKGYICIFICFSTKAMHIELVTDLTAQAFIASFRRFSARRGLPSNVYCDNASNFVRADKEIKRYINDSLNPNLNNTFSDDNVTFHFAPARSPTFQGYVESGVKSVKYHLKRIMGYSVLTYDELHTLLAQIEACLNSRPLSPTSTDPNDLTVLTPGHFLVGQPLTLPPDPSLDDRQLNLLTRWQRVQWMFRQFWVRWRKEVLSLYQQRAKWRQPSSQLLPGTLVLLMDDNLPPLRWSLGRILELHPGADGVSRVATVKTGKRSTTRRAVNRLCPLPLPSELTTFTESEDT